MAGRCMAGAASRAASTRIADVRTGPAAVCARAGAAAVISTAVSTRAARE